MTIIKIEDLKFSYNNSEEILKGLDIEVEKGKLYGLFGPNGSGKTTLLKCLSGFLNYTSGSIKVEGREVKDLSPKELSSYISYVPQDHKISFPFTVEEMVLMGRTPRMGGFFGPKEEDIEAANQAIIDMGIEDIKNRIYTELSGGPRQLVLVARALVQDTPIMVLDEPTSALDFKNQLNVWNTLKSLKKYNKTIITCSHDPNHVTWFCDSVVVIDKGLVVEAGRTEDVMTDRVLNILYEDVCSAYSNGKISMIVPNIE